MKKSKDSHSHATPMFNPKSHDHQHKVNPGRVAHPSSQKIVKTTHEFKSTKTKAPREDYR